LKKNKNREKGLEKGCSGQGSCPILKKDTSVEGRSSKPQSIGTTGWEIGRAKGGFGFRGGPVPADETDQKGKKVGSRERYLLRRTTKGITIKKSKR